MAICTVCNDDLDTDCFDFYEWKNKKNIIVKVRKVRCKVCDLKASFYEAQKNRIRNAARYIDKAANELFKEAERYRRKERYWRKKKQALLDLIKSKKLMNENP